MTSVFLCDDKITWLKRLEKAVEDYMIKSDWELNIAYQSQSPEELLCHLKKNTPMRGIYLLDIDFKSSIDGMELAKHIRELDPQAYIIFVTTHEEMALETFHLKLSVLDYIVKDKGDVSTQVYQCLGHIEKQLLQQKAEPSDAFCLKIGGYYQMIVPNEIYFIETIKNTHKISLHLNSGIYHLPITLSAFQEKVGTNFFQCHKTCLVNLNHISGLDADKRRIVLDNKESCPCSIREWRQLLQKFQTFLTL